MSNASRCVSRPDAVRRGDPCTCGATSACTSTSSGRLPSSVAATATPGAPSDLALDERRAGIGNFAQAVAGHLEDAHLLGRAEAVLARAQQPQARKALALERQHDVHEVLQRLWPSKRPVLGHVADEDDRHAVLLGIGPEAAPRPRGPGRRSRPAPRAPSVVSVWIESTTSSAGAVASAAATMRSTLVSGRTSIAAPAPAPARPRRPARMRSCAADSSPRRTGRGPVAAALRARLRHTPPARASTCRCPARRRAAPANPARCRHPARGRPRVCRSRRGRESASSSSLSGVTRGAATGARAAGLRGARSSTTDSTIVFQLPHERHWPSQRRLVAPHVPHT